MTKHTSTADIIAALENTAGDITAAATLLGLRREAIYYRINKDPGLKRIIEELRTARDHTTGTPDQTDAPREQAGQASAAEPEAENIEELLKQYRDLEEAARREFIPIVEGLRPPTGPAAESAPAPNEGETAPDQETPAPIGTPTEKPAEKLPYITQCIIRQEAANLSAYLKSYIASHGLPRQYGEVIGYIEYLDKTAAGNA